MKIQTKELSGTALDWAVAYAIGEYRPVAVPNYSTDWAQGGPIIEREFITNGPHQIKGEVVGSCALGLKTDWSYGPTPLIAAMRCYVASKLGDKIEVPDELV